VSGLEQLQETCVEAFRQLQDHAGGEREDTLGRRAHQAYREYDVERRRVSKALQVPDTRYLSYGLGPDEDPDEEGWQQ
jgi:hypothetical protein